MEPVPVSVVIPVRDEPRTAEAVAAVLGQEGFRTDAEILVVGSGIPALPADPRIAVVETPPGTSPGGNRNRGIDRARGRALVFLDADCVPRSGWLAALLAALERAPVVSGAVSLRAAGYGATAYNVTAFAPFREGLPPGTRSFLPTLTLAVRREAVEAAGPLDESLFRCEDLDWTMRMASRGFSLAFEPAAVVSHHPRPSTALALSKWRESGAVSLAVRRRHAASGSPEGALARLSPFALRVLSPLLGLAAALRTFASPGTWPFLHTLPVVYLTKVAWCLGAADGREAAARITR